MQTGRSAMVAAKTGIATTGHNISNANTEGYSRQRVSTHAAESIGGQFGKNTVGTGVAVSRVERLNDHYIEKQIRNSQKDLSHFEEKDLILRQVEDIFNEMSGDGLNRFISRFFNEFRKLSEEPESPAIRQSLRESAQSMTNDFHRLRQEVVAVAQHADQRIEGFVGEVNHIAQELADLNQRISWVERSGGSPNDLLDKRDLIFRKLGSYFDVSMSQDKNGSFNVDIKGVGPLVMADRAEHLSVEGTPANRSGKPEAGLDILSSGNVLGTITYSLQGGKLGALIEARDKMIATVLDRLDEMAFALTHAVNQIHSQGFNSEGISGIPFFSPLQEPNRAAEWISLSEEVQLSIDQIATGLLPESPGDNRVALAIAQLQNEKLIDHGHATADEWFNSMVTDVGIASAKNRSSMLQEKDIILQLNKVREQISGVSIDEETANLMEFQHAFDASAKVIQVADDLLKTVLSLKRD